MQKAALYTAGAIFAAGAIGHGFRLINGFEITVGGFTVPMWVSYPGVLAAALLAIWMAAAARRPQA
jgi:hypothetical protein